MQFSSEISMVHRIPNRVTRLPGPGPHFPAPGTLFPQLHLFYY